jgi:hypothetical protein
VQPGDVLAECAGRSANPESVARAFTLGDIAPSNRKIVETVVRDERVAETANVA